MTSYGSERDYLLDQIESNKEAIEFIEEELEKVLTEMPEDHAGTKEKIVSVYARGIEYLKRDNRQKRVKVNALRCDEPEDIYPYEILEILPEIDKGKKNK